MTPDTAFRWVSPSVKGLLGSMPEQMVGRGTLDLLDDADIGIYRTMRTQVLLGPEPPMTREHQMIRSDGDRIWVEHAIGLLWDTEGQPVSCPRHIVRPFTALPLASSAAARCSARDRTRLLQHCVG